MATSGIPPVNAVIWDYDGTLVDTRRKNLAVSRRIVTAVSGRPPDDFPALRSLAAYDRTTRHSANWRDLYRREFGFSQEQTDAAGRLWNGYQHQDDTPTTVFDGIAEVLAHLSGFPHGIVSQNAQSAIARAMDELGLIDHFELIIGYEEVEYARQKPAPDGLIRCIEELTAFRAGIVVYIGDHETDMRCARRANAVLADREGEVNVVTIAALFDEHPGDHEWEVKPDYRAEAPSTIPGILREIRGSLEAD